MLPLKDHNPTQRRALVTAAIVVVCVGVYFFVQGARTGREVLDVPGTDQRVEIDASVALTLEHAAVPCEVVQQEPLDLDELQATFGSGDTEACRASSASPELFPDKGIWRSVLVSMFLHGSLLHLGGNMLYLWIFGNNVEDRLGHAAYLGFYLAGGVVATLAHVLVNADSTVPVVGASGAIAAVMGAYLVWYPNARIRTLVMALFIFFTEVRAKWLLTFWFVLQFFTGNASGVAWVAHVAGFVFGVVAGLLIGPGRARARRLQPTWG